MLGLFAQQNTWAHRNRLVSQKADCVSFEIAMETITQRQDLETQAKLGQTGGVVWDAAVVLSRFLCQYAASLGLPVGDSARWLELGAGCGAVGIAASKLLPVPVVLSDQYSILPILQKNLLENRCTARTTLALLDWGKDGESTVELKDGFDVIIGADCVFNENLIDVLIESLLIYAGDKTSVVMATELREPSVTAAFLHAAAKAFGECRRCARLSSSLGRSQLSHSGSATASRCSFRNEAVVQAPV
jgi:predicted nicotinamide N-methyase